MVDSGVQTDTVLPFKTEWSRMLHQVMAAQRPKGVRKQAWFHTEKLIKKRKRKKQGSNLSS